MTVPPPRSHAENVLEGSNCIVLIFAKNFGDPEALGKDLAALPGFNLRLAIDDLYVHLKYPMKYICIHICKVCSSR